MSEAKTPGIHVVDIADRKTRINLQTISALQDALEAAKKGEVIEVLIVTFDEDGQGALLYSDSLNPIHRIGALELLKLEAVGDWAEPDEQEGA